MHKNSKDIFQQLMAERLKTQTGMVVSRKYAAKHHRLTFSWRFTVPLVSEWPPHPKKKQTFKFSKLAILFFFPCNVSPCGPSPWPGLVIAGCSCGVPGCDWTQLAVLEAAAAQRPTESPQPVARSCEREPPAALETPYTGRRRPLRYSRNCFPVVLMWLLTLLTKHSGVL